MILSKYSMGIGDRFARQGQAQLRAIMEAKKLGADIVPVWNKSNREHLIVHTHPDTVRNEADAAVKALGWTGPYHVDADHIGLKTVDSFVKASDFFTLDVAEQIGIDAGADAHHGAALCAVQPIEHVEQRPCLEISQHTRIECCCFTSGRRPV